MTEGVKQFVPEGEEIIYNSKRYIRTAKGNIYAVQRKVDTGFCFGRKPTESVKYIKLDLVGTIYKQVVKKSEGTLGPNNHWNGNQRKLQRSRKDRMNIRVTA